VPIACTGKVPGVVKTLLQSQLKSASPNVPVWLDCDDKMVDAFGMTTGQPNVVVLDAAGCARHIHNGTPAREAIQKIAQIIQDLRAEAVK
jgi:predicted transcriptional regulator